MVIVLDSCVGYSGVVIYVWDCYVSYCCVVVDVRNFCVGYCGVMVGIWNSYVGYSCVVICVWDYYEEYWLVSVVDLLDS